MTLIVTHIPRYNDVASLLSAIKVKVPRAQKQKNQVRSNENNVDAQIPPAIIKTELQRLEELVTNLVGTILTHASSVVDNVTSAAALEEVGHVVPTCHTWRSIEYIEFSGSALHSSVVQLGYNHTTDKTSKGIKLVEPGTPKLRDLWLCNCDATEESKSNDYKWIHKRRYH